MLRRRPDGSPLACLRAMADGRLAPRSLAWLAFAERAAVAPSRGRWLALRRAADVEAVARAVVRTLGQRCPAGLARSLQRGMATVGRPAGPFVVDDLRVVLAAAGLPVEAQETLLAVRFLRLCFL